MLLSILMFFFSSGAQALFSAQPLIGRPEIVRVEFENGWVCSGIFIDENTLLTAAHCLTDSKAVAIYSEHDTVVPVKIQKFVRHPKFNDQYWPAYDIGIIKTTKLAKLSEQVIIATESPIHGKAKLFGCGKTELANGYSRTTGENSFIRIGAVLFFVALSEGQNSVIVAPNDSGGPAFDFFSGELIGIATTTSSVSRKFPAWSTATSLVSEENRAFVLSHLGSN